MLRTSIIVRVEGNASATDGSPWYQGGRLLGDNKHSVGGEHSCTPASYLFRFIQDLAILLKPSGLGVVMASKSTSCNDSMDPPLK